MEVFRSNKWKLFLVSIVLVSMIISTTEAKKGNEGRVEEEEKKKEKTLKEDKPNQTEAEEVAYQPSPAPDVDEEEAEGDGEGSGFSHRKVDEKINLFCKPAKDPNLCFNSIVAYIGNKKYAEQEINPQWILKMQVNATINQLLTIQTFIRDMLKQRPQDQVLIHCKDAYFKFATDLGTASAGGDKVALKMLATEGPDKINKDCTSLVDSQPSATTPAIGNTLKEVPPTNAPYLANVATLADQPNKRKLRKMKK